INDYGTVVLFGHRIGSSDSAFSVVSVTANAMKGSRTIQVSSASAYAVGDVITIDKIDGPATAQGPAYFNGGYLWFYDGQFFKRQPNFDWNGPGTGAAPVGSVTDLNSSNNA